MINKRYRVLSLALVLILFLSVFPLLLEVSPLVREVTQGARRGQFPQSPLETGSSREVSNITKTGKKL